jgi:arsenite-transporting ATPase
MLMGKGGVGKTTVAAALAVDLASRGVRVHLTTTDPAAHVQEALGGSVEGLRVSRIDPHAETRAYSERVLAESAATLDADSLALLEEDLRSPCTEEVAVFHAFSRAIAGAEDEVVVVDTAPTGHTLLLLDATGSYHREVMRKLGDEASLTPMSRLRDPDFTQVFVVTLPETTPIEEASSLVADLERAEIHCAGWIVNRSLSLSGSDDPLLRARAEAETPLLADVASRSERLAILPQLAGAPIGPEKLLRLARATPALPASTGTRSTLHA